MDREPARLANHIKRTVAGPMWHGSALAELLEGISAEQAAARPIAGAHSIWEIVAHVTAWAEIARARMHGERLGDPRPEEDWPPPGVTTDAEWAIVLRRLSESHRSLAHEVRHLDEATIDAPVQGLEYRMYDLLHGVIEHGTYHGGQIALLKRALLSPAGP
jgi:uncharacterized damage-inducible protein DinB